MCYSTPLSPKKSLPKFVCYILLMCGFISFQAANVNSVVTGNWTASSTWNTGSTPNQGSDNITAAASYNVVVNTNIGLSGSATLLVNGTLIDPVGGTAYSLTLSTNSSMTVNGKTTFEGALLVQNNATLTINSGDTLTVGAATFINNSVIVVHTGGVLIVNGNLDASNNNGSTIDGKVIVNGNVTASNNVSFSGSGSMSASGTISTSNGATIFGGSGSCGPPCDVSSSAPLPIELLSFTGNGGRAKVNLRWATATETNNHHFDVERSKDAVHFTTAGTVKAAGTGNSLSVNEYSYTDQTPYAGVSYYRLKQVDKNGAYKYYGLIEIAIDKGTFTDLYPNPASGELHIAVSEDQLNAPIHFYDISGRKVMSYTPASLIATCDISSLLPGIYFVQTGTQTIKISVQK